MIRALRNAIYTTGKTVTGLTGNENFFYNEARQTTAFPYCTFKPATGVREWDSGNTFDKGLVQFTFYGKSSGSIETLAENLKAVFDFGKDNISVTGYDTVSCLQQNDIGPLKDDKTWVIVLQYFIEIQKSR